jgi:vacuolar-type H+-ATPase subunit I/STV1
MNISNPECNNTHASSDSIEHEIDEVVSAFIDSTKNLAEDLGATDDVLSDFVDSAESLGVLVRQTAENANAVDQRAAENSDKIQSNSEQIEQLEEHSAKSRAELSSRVATVEQELDEMDDSASSQGGEAVSSEENPNTSGDQNTPLERICALPESVVEDNLTRNQSRARSIALRIGEYGKKVPAGIAIPSSRIKRVLTAQEDSTIHRQTVARVADFLKQFGDGDVRLEKTRSGEKTVVFTEELAEAVTSVVTPNEGSPVTQVVV